MSQTALSMRTSLTHCNKLVNPMSSIDTCGVISLSHLSRLDYGSSEAGMTKAYVSIFIVISLPLPYVVVSFE